MPKCFSITHHVLTGTLNSQMLTLFVHDPMSFCLAGSICFPLLEQIETPPYEGWVHTDPYTILCDMLGL